MMDGLCRNGDPKRSFHDSRSKSAYGQHTPARDLPRCLLVVLHKDFNATHPNHFPSPNAVSYYRLPTDNDNLREICLVPI